MKEQGISFKQAVNDAIRADLGGSGRPQPAFRTRTVAMGQPNLNLDRALQLAGELEDDEIIRKSRLGK